METSLGCTDKGWSYFHYEITHQELSNTILGSQATTDLREEKNPSISQSSPPPPLSEEQSSNLRFKAKGKGIFFKKLGKGEMGKGLL